jgi:hypothetical protein
VLTLLPVSSAHARLVGEFDARVKDLDRVSGAYTVVADAHIYDTAGLPVPALTQAAVRFPRGARLRRQFLRGSFLCDPKLLERRPDPAVCANARFATGRIVLDARPQVVESLPANVHLFLGRPAGPDEIASAIALIVPNEHTPVYAYQVLRGRLLADRGGRFGYRLELPTRIEPLLSTVTLTLAEIHLTVRGLQRAGRAGRRVFWTTAPRCPRGGAVSFGARYAFEGARPISRKRKVDCARLLRRPSVKRQGEIPTG